STPPQFASRSPGALCSLATPAGRTSETTTVTPFAANARAVELPMPIDLPQPLISATRVAWGMGILRVSSLRGAQRRSNLLPIVHPRSGMLRCASNDRDFWEPHLIPAGFP